MSDAAEQVITLPGGLRVDLAAARAHIMQPTHTRGVVSSRGLEEGAKLAARAVTRDASRGFDTDKFVKALGAALADNTAGYVMQLRRSGKPIASAQVNWAKRPSDGSSAWAQTTRMHVASVSKLITAIAMTRTLAAQGRPASTRIIDYLPTYWVKGPNIDAITFAQLLTHTSGFRVDGSDMSFPTMKALIAKGVASHDIGRYSYQNTNFGICRILIPVMNGAIAAGTTFPLPGEDQAWDLATIDAYADYVARYLFAPSGVTGPTLTHPDPDALAYAFPPGAGWNSGDLRTESGGAGWHMSVDDLLDTMGAFRRAGTIMPPAAAQAMLDDGFGIDLIEDTVLGRLYNKNGLWQSGAGQTEQSLAYFLPGDMELAVLANSPIGAAGGFFRDVVTKIYLDSAAAEVSVGEWTARSGLSAAAFQEAFDGSADLGMTLTCVSGYGTAEPRFAGVWEKIAQTPAWQARSSLTPTEYQTLFDQLSAQNYQPVLLNGYPTAAGTRFACIFRQGVAGSCVTRYGLTAAQYQAAFDQFASEGYALEWVSGYFEGGQDRYAAIWRRGSGSPEWQASHNMTSAQYQTFFDDMIGRGLGPAVVCGYSAGIEARFAAIFDRTAGALDFDARHGMTAADYQATFDRLVAQGYRPKLVSGYSVGGTDQFAAIWTK